MRSILAIVALALGLAAAPGEAARAAPLTIEVSHPTTGVPDPARATFLLDVDLGADIATTSAGLTLLSSNVAIDGAVAFFYTAATDFLQIGAGDVLNVNDADNDIFIQIVDLQTAPALTQFAVFQGGISLVNTTFADPLEGTVAVTSGVIPLPPGALLLVTALGLAGIAGRRARA